MENVYMKKKRKREGKQCRKEYERKKENKENYRK